MAVQASLLDRIERLDDRVSELERGQAVGLSDTDQTIKGSHDRLDALMGAGGTTSLQAGELSADATGRAIIAADYFDAATIVSKFPSNSFTNAVLIDLILDGAFQADAATRALFADGIWTADEIANRTRTLFVPGTRGWQIAENESNSLQAYAGEGWHAGDGVVTVVYGEFYVPADYVSGLTVEAVIESVGTAGNNYMKLICYYAAEGETWDAANNATGYSAIAAVAELDKVLSTASSAVAGDFVTCRWERKANDANDTNTAGICHLKGFLATFLADS